MAALRAALAESRGTIHALEAAGHHGGSHAAVGHSAGVCAC
jgi:hypothetical protein